MTTKDLSSLSTPRKLVLGAAALLLIDSFLPWYHISLGALGGGVSASGWHGVGTIAWLLAIVLIAVEGGRIFDVLPLGEARAELASLAAAAGVLLFGVIYVIVRLSDGYLGFGFWIGVVGLIVLGVGAYGAFRSGDALATAKGLKAAAATPPADDTAPPAPPAPPTA